MGMQNKCFGEVCVNASAGHGNPAPVRHRVFERCQQGTMGSSIKISVELIILIHLKVTTSGSIAVKPAGSRVAQLFSVTGSKHFLSTFSPPAELQLSHEIKQQYCPPK